MWAHIVAVGIGVGVFLLIGWYWWFRRYNRRRATEVVGWIERTFHGHGQIAGVEWDSASRFSVKLHLLPSLFRHVSLLVQFLPRQSPIHWLLSRIKKHPETVMFQADLDGAPSFNLEVHNHRWYGRTRRRLSSKTQDWTLEQVGPFVMTTRNEWQHDITGMMRALVASRECDVLTVCFRRRSPHFSVTVPLETLAPESGTQSDIFDVLRELAAGAASARF
jgi:hypothetical protein